MYLDSNLNEFEYYKFMLETNNIKYSVFIEPDIGNQEVAICFYSDNIFKKLKVAN